MLDGSARRLGDAPPPAAYAPLPVSVEGLCQTLRHVMAGGGYEAIGALTAGGALDKLAALAALSGRLGEVPGGAHPGAAERAAAALGGALRFAVSKAWSELGAYCGAGGQGREALALLPAPALAALLRVSARAAVAAGGGPGGGAEEEALAEAAAALGGLTGGAAALWGVLAEAAADTLAAAKLAAPQTPGGEAAPIGLGATPEARAQLKLFRALLASAAARGLRPPATLPALRGLLGALLAGLAWLEGGGPDAFTAPLLASATAALYRDPAPLEHIPPEERAKESEDCSLWAVKPGAVMITEVERVEEV